MLDPSINVADARNLDLLLDVLGSKSMPHMVYSSFLGMMVKLVKTGAINLASAGPICGQIERVRDSVGPTSQTNKRLAKEKLSHLYKILWRAMVHRSSMSAKAVDDQSFRDFYDFITNSRFLIVSAPKLRERLMTEVSQRAFPKPRYLQPQQIEKYLKDWLERLEAPATEPNPHGMYALATDHIVYVLNSLSEEEAHRRIIITTKQILSSRPLDVSEKACWTAALRIWASCVVRSHHFIRAGTNDVQCREIVELVAPLVKPVDLAFFFDRLDARDGARLLMQTWLKRRILDNACRNNSFPIEPVNSHEYRGRMGMKGQHSSSINELLALRTPHPLQQAALDATFRSHQAAFPVENKSIGEQYFSLISSNFEEYQSRHPSTLPSHSILAYMDLIAAVSHTGLSYRRLMAELFHLFLRFHHPIAPADAMHAMHQTHGIRTLRGLATHLINHYTTHDPVEALHIFRLSNCIPLRRIRRDFLHRVVDAGLISPHLIRQLIMSPHRKLRPRACVDLLHDVAETCAHSANIHHLSAADFAHDLFVALRERGVHMDARLSRAFVHAVVIRPLRMGDWVSTMRFRVVLDAVRWIEGADAADRLDALVWRWRGKVLWERRAAYPRLGDVAAYLKRKAEVDEMFVRQKLARERQLVEESRRGGDGDFDEYRFWKSVPAGEEVKNMRLYYLW